MAFFPLWVQSEGILAKIDLLLLLLIAERQKIYTLIDCGRIKVETLLSSFFKDEKHPERMVNYEEFFLVTLRGDKEVNIFYLQYHHRACHPSNDSFGVSLLSGFKGL